MSVRFTKQFNNAWWFRTGENDVFELPEERPMLFDSRGHKWWELEIVIGGKPLTKSELRRANSKLYPYFEIGIYGGAGWWGDKWPAPFKAETLLEMIPNWNSKHRFVLFREAHFCDELQDYKWSKWRTPLSPSLLFYQPFGVQSESSRTRSSYVCKSGSVGRYRY